MPYNGINRVSYYIDFNIGVVQVFVKITGIILFHNIHNSLHKNPPIQMLKVPLINWTLISGPYCFSRFPTENYENHIKVALIYSRLNKSVLP
jgi:hypothetical protein